MVIFAKNLNSVREIKEFLRKKKGRMYEDRPEIISN